MTTNFASPPSGMCKYVSWCGAIFFRFRFRLFFFSLSSQRCNTHAHAHTRKKRSWAGAVKELTDLFEKMMTLKRVAVRLHRRNDTGELFEYAVAKIANAEERLRYYQQQYNLREEEVNCCRL